MTRTIKECEADLEAWADILLQINYDNPEEAEAIFLTRCAKSAQEVLAERDNHKAALEDSIKIWDKYKIMMDTVPSYMGTPEGERLWAEVSLAHRRALDALTPAPGEGTE